MRRNYQKIKASRNTPEVILDPEGVIKFTGRLIPENAEEFFLPIREWVSEYSADPSDNTTFEIFLEYLNSAGTKYLLSLMNDLVYSGKDTTKVIVNWYYEEADQDMLDKGTILSMNLNLPFNFLIKS